MGMWVQRLVVRVMLSLLGLLLVFVVAAGAVIYWAAVHPADAWRFAHNHLLPKDLNVEWREIGWQPKKISWRHWEMAWTVKGLRVEKGSPKVAAPIDEVSLVFSFRVFAPDTHIDFANVVVHADDSIVYEGDPNAPPSPEQSPFQQVDGLVHYLTLGNSYASMKALDVRIKDLIYKSTPASAPLRLNVAISKGDGDVKEAYVITASAAAPGWTANVRAPLVPARLGSAEPFLTGKAAFNGYGTKLDLSVTLAKPGDVLQATFEGPVAYVSGQTKMHALPKLTVKMSESQAELALNTSLSGLPGPVVNLANVESRLSVPLQNNRMWADQPSTFSLNGPVGLFFVSKNMRPPLESSCACRIPETVQVRLSGQAWLNTWLGPTTTYKRPVVKARLVIDSIRNRLFAVNLAANVEITKEKDAYAVLPTLDSDVHLYSFKGLRKFLDSQNIIVPAPLDKLEGTVDVEARSPVPQEQNARQTLVTSVTKLASDHQKVNLNADFRLKLDPSLKSLDVIVKLLIDDLQLELPPLDPIAGMPKIARDERIQLRKPVPAPAKKEPAFKVNLWFEAKTAHAGAIRFLSQYAKPNVPLTVNASRAADGDMVGTVQLEPFEIRYLRRSVHVEQVRMVMENNETGNFPIDGRLRVDQTQYRIFIEISGTMRSPSMRLTSEPYLPRSEIISVLLYDRTSDQLVSGDAETAGSMEAAMADRAIGLFGLWALASTPIKSFSYNPVTKVYSATVQVTGDVTAGIGTNWEEAASLELRKRVSKRWVLTASWSPSETNQSQVGKLVLQWEKRF